MRSLAQSPARSAGRRRRRRRPPPKAVPPKAARPAGDESTKLEATKLEAKKRGAAKQILGDAHGDKESINPSQHARPSSGTFSTEVFLSRPAEVALVFSRVYYLGRLPALVFLSLKFSPIYVEKNEVKSSKGRNCTQCSICTF